MVRCSVYTTVSRVTFTALNTAIHLFIPQTIRIVSGVNYSYVCEIKGLRQASIQRRCRELNSQSFHQINPMRYLLSLHNVYISKHLLEVRLRKLLRHHLAIFQFIKKDTSLVLFKKR